MAASIGIQARFGYTVMHRGFSPKPECCVCHAKIYAKGSSTWHLMDVTRLKGYLLSERYPYQKGVVCGICKRKASLLGPEE
jgi:hypothetical protein